ncbi:MAG TPA: DUF6232 family protein [Trinickia sp.]|uniref:DUF6232 family protein n=1 Tax=Trinickia sp. TaxID=2571163 RepID=UPI002F3ED295
MENTFNERGVTITRGGLSAGGQMFPLREIREVRVVTVHKNKVLPVGISVLGAAAAIGGGIFGSSAALVVGVMLVVVGGLTWYTQDVTHRLIVTTANGEREALTSPDRAFAEHVERVLRDALGRSAQPV